MAQLNKSTQDSSARATDQISDSPTITSAAGPRSDTVNGAALGNPGWPESLNPAVLASAVSC